MTRSALRAAARIAWRQARRAPGRSALVTAMIAIPIAALTLGATLIRTSVPTLEERITSEMGSAELRVQAGDPRGLDVARIRAHVPARSKVVVVRQWNQTQVVNGSLVYTTVWEPSVPLTQPPIAGLYQLIDGRAPTSRGEAAVDPRVLEIFDVGIGADIAIGDRSFQVVGVAARPSHTWDALLVVGPGSLTQSANGAARDDEVFLNSVLVDLPTGADPVAAERALETSLLRGAQPGVVSLGEQTGEDPIWTRADVAATSIDDAPRLTGFSFAGTALVLFGTGLIVAAAFAVGIRRQLRMLGLVGATGGGRSHVRAVVLFGGTTLGAVGATLGAIAGIAGAYAVTPSLYRFTRALPGDVLIPWPTIVGAVVLGTVAATVAAAWPARLAARISTLDALAVRMPPPRAPGRVARGGLVVVLLGAVVTGVTARQGANQVALTAGVLMIVGGFLVAVPLLVQIAGRLAPTLPPAARLALRETARYGRRTGTAIAATAIALMLPIAATALTLSEEAFQRRVQWMGKEHLLVGVVGGESAAVRPSHALLADIKNVLPGAIGAPHRAATLDLKRYPPTGFEPEGPYPAYVEGPLVAVEGPGGGQSYREQGQVFIGGPDLLRALGAEEGIPALQAGKIVAIGPDTTDDGTVHLTLATTQDVPPRVPLPAVEAGDVRYALEDSLPRYVVSPAGARAHGLLRGELWNETLVAAAAPLTSEQIASVKRIAEQHPLTYIRTVDDFVPGFGSLRLAITAAATIVALAIVAITVSLVGAEARRDQAILVALGAGPPTRRRIAAARAGLIALIAGAIAVPAGFMPVALFQWTRPESYPVVAPWTTMLLVALAVPLITFAFGAVTSRSPRTLSLLQPVV